VSDYLAIQSHTGKYAVEFINEAAPEIHDYDQGTTHFIVDNKIIELYENLFKGKIGSYSILALNAIEGNKSLEKIPEYIDFLLRNNIRRDHRLVAVGGGIIQDITCFISATLMRGINWEYYPTTLLAQADSCIGSKSSINCGKVKNIIGTFTPPQKVVLYVKFLKTLEAGDLKSGIGEIIKVHIINGQDSFKQLSKDYFRLFSDHCLLLKYIRKSLEIKKRYIEMDEFDRGERRIFNYGHTFGHAIESSTDFMIPHGIAVTIGMDMANFIAMSLGRISRSDYLRIKALLAENYSEYAKYPIPVDRFITALARDKKNKGGNINSVLLNDRCEAELHSLNNNRELEDKCISYFNNERHI